MKRDLIIKKLVSIMLVLCMCIGWPMMSAAEVWAEEQPQANDELITDNIESLTEEGSAEATEPADVPDQNYESTELAGCSSDDEPDTVKGPTSDLESFDLKGIKEVNPLTQEYFRDKTALKSATLLNDAGTDEYYTSEADATEAIRQHLVGRDTFFAVGWTYTCKKSSTDAKKIAQNGLGNFISNALKEHTGYPDEGDYLHWHFSKYSGNGSISLPAKYVKGKANKCYAVYIYQVSYYTTSLQEHYVENQVNSILTSLDISEDSDVMKIAKIYEWICNNITYDYEGANAGAGDVICHTAYGALHDRNCVCQGYSSLFYRMLLTAGIDARMQGGLRSAGVGHIWNIVNIGDTYYFCDPTWDSELLQDDVANPHTNYFLMGEGIFFNGYQDPSMTCAPHSTYSELYSLDKTYSFAQKAYGLEPGDYPELVSNYVKGSFTEGGAKVSKIVGLGSNLINFDFFPAAGVITSTVDKVYNGKVQTSKTFDVTAIDKTGLTYELDPESAKNVGVYHMGTYSISNDYYEDSAELTFKIIPKAAKIRTPKRLKKGFTAKWYKQTSKMSKSRITGYQIEYSTSKSFTDPTFVNVKGYKKYYKKFTGLQSKKKYYVRVRAYMTVDGNDIYSKWSSTKSVTTK